MSNKIVVAVSPFYQGPGWVDEYTLISFKPNDNYSPIEIDKSANLSGIKRSLQLNTLVLLEGELPEAKTLSTKKLDPAELSTDSLSRIMATSTSTTSIPNPDIDALKARMSKLEQVDLSRKKDIDALKVTVAELKTRIVAQENLVNSLKDELAKATTTINTKTTTKAATAKTTKTAAK